jgi:hypothetical protein
LFGLRRANVNPDFFTKDHEGHKEKGPRGTLRNANKISHKGTKTQKDDKPIADKFTTKVSKDAKGRQEPQPRIPKAFGGTFSGLTQIYKDESICVNLRRSAVCLSSLCGFVPLAGVAKGGDGA